MGDYVLLDMPPMTMIPIDSVMGAYRSPVVDAFHVLHQVPKISVGGVPVTLVEVEATALALLHMVRTHPGGDGLQSQVHPPVSMATSHVVRVARDHNASRHELIAAAGMLLARADAVPEPVSADG